MKKKKIIINVFIIFCHFSFSKNTFICMLQKTKIVFQNITLILMIYFALKTLLPLSHIFMFYSNFTKQVYDSLNHVFLRLLRYFLPFVRRHTILVTLIISIPSSFTSRHSFLKAIKYLNMYSKNKVKLHEYIEII